MSAESKGQCSFTRPNWATNTNCKCTLKDEKYLTNYLKLRMILLTAHFHSASENLVAKMKIPDINLLSYLGKSKTAFG